MALTTPAAFLDHSNVYYKPIGSDAGGNVSYMQWRMCTSSGREWVGIDSQLPVDSTGKSFLSLTGPGAEGRPGAWPALWQKAYSKFLIEHPELSNDPSQPGLQNIVGNNPQHAINVVGCTTAYITNPHPPIGYGQTPNFSALRQQIQSLLSNQQQFALLTTISDRIFTRDGTYDQSNDSVTYTFGANLRRQPLANFGQTLTYTSPNGGNTVIVPAHCYHLQVLNAAQGTFTLTSPWGFSLTPDTGVLNTTGPSSITVTADLIWSVGDTIYSGNIDQP